MLITNGTLITFGKNPQILQDYAIRIKDGKIDTIGPTESFSITFHNEKQLDAQGQLVMPGNICAHTHFYGAYARGMAIPGQAPINFPEILSRLWWTLDKALDKDAVRMSALVSLVDAIKHGTTTLIDHHASPNIIDGSLNEISSAVQQAGLRAVLCYEVSDRDGREKAEAGIEENINFIKSHQANPFVRGTFGLHASLSLSDETLKACSDALPDGAGFHIHVAEHEADEEDSLKRSNKRVVQRLNEYGIWGERSIAAHCVHIDNNELDTLIDSGTWITHQPRSNMNNAVGTMNWEKFIHRGAKLGLGNDGFSNNMWAEWKTAYLLHKVINRDPRVANGTDIANVAIENNARLAEVFFPEHRFGEIKEGATADLIFVDYRPFTPLEPENLPWHILFGFEASMVTTTIVGGHILMSNRQLVTLNEKAIVHQAHTLAPSIWERYNQFAAQS